MATASQDMTQKLVKDAKQAESDIAELEKYLDAAEDHDKEKPKGPCQAIERLIKDYNKVAQQVAKFERGLKAKPLSLPDEKDYKNLRKTITNAAKFIDMTQKNVKKEAAEKKKDVEIQCIASAKGDFIGGNTQKAMCAALKTALANRGRTGPKKDGVDEFLHIHVAGSKVNVLHRKKVLLGTVDFHIDSGNNKQQIKAVEKVAKASGSKVTLIIGADNIIREKGK